MNLEQSQGHHKRACNSLPLGVAESYRYWGKETVFVKKMQDGEIIDEDGNHYLDFRLGYGPIILGYQDKRVDDAVVATIREKGTTCGFASTLEYEVAELVKALCPGIEKLRFANSGTEAVLGAVRTARGYTQRNNLVVIEGGFHGLFDEMMWKSDVDNWEPDAKKTPEIVSFGAGLPHQSRQLVDLVPLNSIEALESIFAAKGETIAAVVIEPIMGNCGSISATQEYLQALRKTCDKYGSLLIVDEVKTGFRVARGGAQQHFDVIADIATFAKAMGNGYPIAAFGGKSEIMDKISFNPGGVVHGGTYSGNLVGLAAAKATLEIIKDTNALAKIAEIGDQIKSILHEEFGAHSISLSFAGHSSMFGVHLSDSIPENYRDWKKTNADLYTKFAKNLIKLGIMVEPDSREPWFICEAHEKMDLQILRKKIRRALELSVPTS